MREENTEIIEQADKEIQSAETNISEQEIQRVEVKKSEQEIEVKNAEQEIEVQKSEQEIQNVENVEAQKIEEIEDVEARISEQEIKNTNSVNKETENNNYTILKEQNKDENDNKNSSKTKKRNALNKYTIIITVITILLFVGLAIFSTIFALLHTNSGKIANGVLINGIDVSNLTKEEAYKKINDIYSNKITENISVVHGDISTNNITPKQIDMEYKIDEAIDIAYAVGRSGKILKDNYTLINAILTKIEIKPAYQYNEKSLTDWIVSQQLNLPDGIKESSYEVNGQNLIITKGKQGAYIKQEELKQSIISACNNILENNIKIELPIEEKQPQAINLEKIRDEIYKEPKDAYYTKNPFTVYPHVDGIDFNITIEEANNLLLADAEQITIPLKITHPKVTTNQIGVEAFPDLLATYSTTFATSNKNRATNIRLATNKINGTVVMPGENFSYNKVVGKRTAEAGYKTAAVYVNGKVENGIGGGICQVSSTLYNSALRANLEIVKRSNHRFATGYVPLSTDATVSWGGPEFIFKNSRKYPIKIVASVNGGKITINIFGCKEDVEYEVVIQSQTLQTIPSKKVYRTNTALPKGTTKTVQKGHAGYKSRAYRILKLNGEVVSKQLLSTDTYAQLETIIEQNP